MGLRSEGAEGRVFFAILTAAPYIRRGEEIPLDLWYNHPPPHLYKGRGNTSTFLRIRHLQDTMVSPGHPCLTLCQSQPERTNISSLSGHIMLWFHEANKWVLPDMRQALGFGQSRCGGPCLESRSILARKVLARFKIQCP